METMDSFVVSVTGASLSRKSWQSVFLVVVDIDIIKEQVVEFCLRRVVLRLWMASLLLYRVEAGVFLGGGRILESG